MSQNFLYSMSEFMPLVCDLLPAADGFSLTEIGSELGAMTRELMRLRAQGRLGDYTIIEPFPSEPLLALAAEDRFRLVQALSVDALDGAPARDVYLVDGDHNYHTVARETRLILEAAARDRRAPLVLYHDVCWPCGDRDGYYAPETIPAGDRRPHTHHLGPVPGEAGVSAAGWRSVGVMAFASEAGGPGNGIRTALEDVLRDHPGWELHIVPCILGLGVLFPAGHPEAERLRAVLAPYEHNFLLAKLERNRLDLVMEVQALEDARDAQAAYAAEQAASTSLGPEDACRSLEVCLEEAGDAPLDTEPLLSPLEQRAEVWSRLRREGELSGAVPLETFSRLRGDLAGAAGPAYLRMAALVRDPAACARTEAAVLAALQHRQPAPPRPYGSLSFLGRERLLLQAPLLSEPRRQEARAACVLLGTLPFDRRTLNPTLPEAALHLAPVLGRYAAWCLQEAVRLGVSRLTVLPDRLEVLPALLAQQAEAAGLDLRLETPAWSDRDLRLAALPGFREEGLGRLGTLPQANGVAGAAEALGLAVEDLPAEWLPRFAAADPRQIRLALLEAAASSALRPRIEAGARAARERVLAAGLPQAVAGLGWDGASVDALNRLARDAGRPERCHGLFLDPPGDGLGGDLWTRFDPDSPLLAPLWTTPEATGEPSARGRLRAGLLAAHRLWVQP